MQRERKEQEWLVQWFKLKYKDELIVAIANGGKRDLKEAVNLKKEGVLPGMPDLQIIKALRGHHGLFIEMKAPATPTLPRGRLNLVQKARLNKLNSEGYYAIAAWGWVEAKNVIDWYFGEE